jgi:hypothetical protein
MHPWGFSPRPYYSSLPKISKMPADLWLMGLKDLNEEADAYFLIPH